MTLFLTNLNVYVMVITPPSLLLSLSNRTLISLVRLLGVSVVVQLVLLIITEGLLSLTSPKFPRSFPRLAVEIFLCGILNPLATFCYCYFTLHNPRVSKMLAVRTASSAATVNELEQKNLNMEMNEVEGVFRKLQKKYRRWHLAISLRLTKGNTGALIAVVVPWFYAHFVLRYWFTWYESMRSFGDSAGVWTGVYEQFFYFLASLAIGGHTDAVMTAFNHWHRNAKTSTSNFTSSGSQKEQHKDGKSSQGKSLGALLRFLTLSLFIFFSTAGVVFFCENRVVDNIGISVSLVSSILWSVS